MRSLQQSTAYNLQVFMTDSSDHVTGKTGLTLTITASKAGAAFASISPTVTERGTGWYDLALTTSHTDTAGDLALHVTSTGADPTDLVCQVQPFIALIDAAISSRLATAGYTAPPSAATNATAVRTELTTELGRIDAAITTRLATAGYTAPLDAAGTRTAVGLASANLDTQLAAIDDYLDTEVAAIKAKTDNLPASPAATGDIPTAAAVADAVWDEARAGHVAAGSFGEGVASVQGNVTGSVDSVTGAVGSVTGAVGSVTGAVGSVTAGVTVTTNNDKTGYRMSATGVDDVLRTALTEGYATAGSAFTLEQGLYMTWQALQGFAIAGTTITGKRLNGTAGMTWTLDSAVTPTSRVRAT